MNKPVVQTFDRAIAFEMVNAENRRSLLDSLPARTPEQEKEMEWLSSLLDAHIETYWRDLLSLYLRSAPKPIESDDGSNIQPIK